MECTVEDCPRPFVAKGFCDLHYNRWRKHGDPMLGAANRRNDCSVPGCDHRHKGHGFCEMHLDRSRKGVVERPANRPRYFATPQPYSLEPTEAAWAAGFFDGEGAIVTPGRRNIQLSMAQVSKEPLEKFQGWFGGKLFIDRTKDSRKSDAWRWMLSGSRVADVLEALMPYLIVKREVACFGIQLARMVRFERGMAWSRIGLGSEEIAEREALAGAIRALGKMERPRQRL